MGKTFQVPDMYQWVALMRGYKDKESRLVAFVFCFVKFWEHISFGVYFHVKKSVSELINGPGRSLCYTGPRMGHAIVLLYMLDFG